jgi:predicted CXXCH cytochrome family protein
MWKRKKINNINNGLRKMIGKLISKLISKLVPGLLLLLLVTVFPFIFFEACSSSKHYKTLSVFFEGVPNPSVQQVTAKKDTFHTASGVSADGRKHPGKTEAQIIVHPPYKQKKCEACHKQGDMDKTLIRQATACYKCHEDFSIRYNRLHGPVGGGYCSACHNPHFSDNARLLKRPGQKLCLYCHNATELVRVEIHRMVGDANCTSCHNPHGGSDGTFLK